MKTITNLSRIFIPIALMLFAFPEANAQLLKKLGKTAERAAERTVQRRVDRETTEKTDQVLDSVLEPGSKGRDQYPTVNNDPNAGSGGAGGTMNSGGPVADGGPKTIEVYSKFDFVPGDKQLFFDDFGNDFIGDFPAKWNTNGSGEVVTIGNSPEKWFEMQPGYNTYYIPDVPNFPEEYTVEFDLLALGIDQKTASTTVLNIIFSKATDFNKGYDYFYPSLPLCQYHPVGIHVRNYKNPGGGDINNNITADIRQAILNQPHISIAVNKQRFRLWVDEKKVVDIPRFVPAGMTTNQLMFEVRNLKYGKERLFIKNLKVAEGGLDLRRVLIAEGKVSTNGILFDSGSANIQPQSMGIIRQISQVLMQEKDMRLNIVGHTDSDGDDASNMDLSKRRADAVMQALVNVYNIDAGRLQTGGKGEMEPVGDNGTIEGKAQNRRVEFIKI